VRNIFSQAGVQLAGQWTLCGQPGGCAGQLTFGPVFTVLGTTIQWDLSRAGVGFEVKEWRLATDHSSRLSRADYGTFQVVQSYHKVRGGAMYCNDCGKVIQDDALVCAYCGIRVGASLARLKLVRPRLGRKVAGVCLGFSEYFDIDVTLVRVVWLIVAFMTGVGFLSYLIAWIIMPEEPLLLPAPQLGAQPATNL
jgi:phage shock protein C